jgi:hypothetical protein
MRIALEGPYAIPARIAAHVEVHLNGAFALRCQEAQDGPDGWVDVLTPRPDGAWSRDRIHGEVRFVWGSEAAAHAAFEYCAANHPDDLA